MRDTRNMYKISVRKSQLDGRQWGGRVLKWLLKKQDETMWTKLFWLRMRTSDGLLGTR